MQRGDDAQEIMQYSIRSQKKKKISKMTQEADSYGINIIGEISKEQSEDDVQQEDELNINVRNRLSEGQMAIQKLKTEFKQYGFTQ